MKPSPDDAASPARPVIVGAGHNGLVAAAVLARRGRRPLVLEASTVLGGACRTEYPFAAAPGLGCSTGAYLLGPMPPEVLAATGLQLELIPRRPHGYFLIEDDRPVAFGIPGGDANLHPADRAALDRVDACLAALREDIAPLWLSGGHTSGDSVAAVRNTPVQGVDDLTVREAYRHLLEGSVLSFLGLFGFRSEFLKAVVATDGLVGSALGPGMPGTGMNFLAHNMLRLPPGDHPGSATPLGAWQLVRGGMGAVTAGLARVVESHAGEIRLGTPARRILLDGERAVGVELASGERIAADTVILATDPFRGLALCDSPRLRPLERRLKAARSPGTSLKVNLALRRLPRVVAAEAFGGAGVVLRGTVHVLPRQETFARLDRCRMLALGGELNDSMAWDAMVDVYTHTAADDSLRDAAGRHAMSFFVQWVPPETTESEAEAFAWSLINGPVGGVMPDLAECVEEVMVLPPGAIERRFGITGGHIHHVDNGYAFEARLGAVTPVRGLLMAGAGCHPAGSVIGCGGLIAAEVALGASWSAAT